MKQSIFLSLFCIQFLCGIAQTPIWTWVRGDKISNQIGSYGNLGEPSTSNKPGSRYGSIHWTDKDGRLWLFGGYGFDETNQCIPSNCYRGYLNDLWSFDPTIGQWTWMGGDKNWNQASVYGEKGVASFENKPGARHSASTWIGNDGKLWMFGGGGIDAQGKIGRLNDLWNYDPQTGFWTWVMGDQIEDQNGIYGNKGEGSEQNKPGARMFSSQWTGADGKLWLMGGFGRAENGSGGTLNDMWNFDPQTGFWTWVAGDKTYDQPGKYGTKGEEAPSNYPPNIAEAMSWTGSDGRFWLMGGRGYLAENKFGDYNDLWSYNPSNGYWTWQSGTQDINQFGQYGTKGISAPENFPGGRFRSVTWTSNDGKLWLMGGFGYTGDTSLGYNNFRGLLNEMWSYDPQTGNWTWQGGEIGINHYGVYGNLNTSSQTNYPGSRNLFSSWTGKDGRLWMFGGNGTDELGNGSTLNDLWVIDLNSPVNTVVNNLDSLAESISNPSFDNSKKNLLKNNILSNNKYISINEKASIPLGPQVSLLPNPGRGDYQLSLKGFDKGSLQLRVMDIFGRVVYSKLISMNSDHLLLALDLKKMPAGIYFAHLQQKYTSQSVRIVKE